MKRLLLQLLFSCLFLLYVFPRSLWVRHLDRMQLRPLKTGSYFRYKHGIK